MKFGVNYTPRVGWFHHWVDYDPGEVARDFDTIRELGADHVRVFPLWPVFEPNPTYVSPVALRRLGETIELAAERGLGVAVDGLQGHLSSFDFLPSWLLTWHRRNLFTDPFAMEATHRYLRELAELCAGHDNVFALTIGNEVNQFTGTVHPEPHPATPRDITLWLDTMLSALREGAPGKDVLHSCYDASWYDDAQPFTLEHVARWGDITAVHAWVFNGTAQRFGPDSFETRAHARYMVEVARAFQVDPERPIWLQEIGAPRNVLPEASVEPFIRETVAQAAGAGLSGITWWCSHDVARGLGDYPELEYDLGLIDETGRIKREGRIVAEAVAEAAATPVERSTASLALDLADHGGRAALAPGGSFWNDYMTTARTFGHPRITLVGDRVGLGGLAHA